MAKKTSNTEVGIVSPITAYSNSKEAATISPALVNIIKTNIVGSNISFDLEADDIKPSDVSSVDDLDDPDNPNDPENNKEKPEDQISKKAPTLMDVELVSKSVSYSTAGIPSVTVMFKIKNSSGESVKSVNARVQL